MSKTIIGLAIDHIGREDFELWVQQVLQLADGFDFEPTGGIHDGGQDGFVRSTAGQPDQFVQISKEKETASKIRKTVRRIRETRNLSKLIYVTSQEESERDLIEAKIKKELDIDVTIHDKRWLIVQATVNRTLEDNLYNFAKDIIDGIKEIRNSDRYVSHSDRLSIVTYLEAQVRSLPGTENFQDLCLDTLIYKALEGTDPDQGIFLMESEIRSSIQQSHPNVLAKSTTPLRNRLSFLCSKDNDPRIRRHPEGKYALPFSVRNQFNEKNVTIKDSEDAFLGSIRSRISSEEIVGHSKFEVLCVRAIFNTIHEIFRTQAMHFAASFSNPEMESDIRVFDIIEKQIGKLDVPSEEIELFSDITSLTVRRICYSARSEERSYISYLMKYYTLTFIMDGNDAVVQYFSDMASRLRIYVGTDIIVRCLSETLVQEPSRGMTNALLMLTECGVKLRVTRQVLNEVYSHIRLTNSIFRSDYEHWYRHASLEAGKNADRILIRAFFYAYFEPGEHYKRPKDWSSYLENFGSASWFSNHAYNEDDFGSFLIDKYHLEFVEIDDVRSHLDDEIVDKIANAISEYRDYPTEGHMILAKNDAEMALFVNFERKRRSERVTTNLYGYDTWWLTEETAVLRALRLHGQPADVVMHPQFLMNHYLLDPRMMGSNSRPDNVVTPTLFGLRITNRVAPGDMKRFVESLGDLSDLDESAIRARIRLSSNRLKRQMPGRQLV